MKRRIINTIAVAAIITGISLLLYPTVSNYYNTSKHRRVILNYLATVEELSETDYTEILEKAREYNAKLAASPPGLMDLSPEQKAEYESVLDVTGTGIMGYIEINKADIYLPIYHGTTDPVLQVGAGHLEGSSLPIGGASTHSMMSGHRGLPSAMLFTNLDQLTKGDRFFIRVLDEVYAYEIYDIETVDPSEVNSLRIEQGKDLCTLITCTPYGINTQRLLLHGKRVEIPLEQEKISIQSGARHVNAFYVILAIEIPAIILTVVTLLHRRTGK